MQASRPPDDRRYANSLIGFQVTGGSSSVRAMWEPLRRAGAVARVMLISAAAQGWNVDPTSCRAEKGEVIHGPTGRKLSYGALADTAAALPVPDSVALKDAKAFKLIGTPAKRVDTPDKVNGKALFGIDVKIPGMKIATVAALPGLGRQARPRRRQYRNRDQWRPPGGAPRRCRCGGRRPYVGGDSRPCRARHRMGRGPEREGLQRRHRAADGDSLAEASRRWTQGWRCRQGHGRRRNEGRSGVPGTFSRARHDGADELHSPCAPGRLRCVGRFAGRQSRPGDGRRSYGPAARASPGFSTTFWAMASVGDWRSILSPRRCGSPNRSMVR